MNQNIKKILQMGLLAVFFIFIIVYAYLRSHNLIFGVKIINVNLVDGEKIANSVLEVSGNAKNATNLTLDGREISIDETGNFKETIALHLGYNVLAIRAIDKFGHMDEKDYKLIYEP